MTLTENKYLGNGWSVWLYRYRLWPAQAMLTKILYSVYLCCVCISFIASHVQCFQTWYRVSFICAALQGNYHISKIQNRNLTSQVIFQGLGLVQAAATLKRRRTNIWYMPKKRVSIQMSTIYNSFVPCTLQPRVSFLFWFHELFTKILNIWVKTFTF